MSFSNAVELTPVQAVRTGLVQATILAAASANGNKWHDDGRCVLIVKNDNAAACVVTKNIDQTQDGNAVAAPTVSVAAGAVGYIGPFTPLYQNGGTDMCYVTYGVTASVTVAVVRV